MVGERDTPTGRSLYIARPMQIGNPACLTCHSTPDAAPVSMIKLYGSANGFGWKLNEIIGAQIVSVPTTVPFRNAQTTFYTFMASLVAIFAVVFVVLNVMLSWLIIRPISQMSSAADQVSTGNFEVAELPETGKDEIALLGRAFNRMRRSLHKAMQMIEA
jgi:protein-histidine pros-kinase